MARDHSLFDPEGDGFHEPTELPDTPDPEGELRRAIRHYLASDDMSPAAVATVPGSKIAGQDDHEAA